MRKKKKKKKQRQVGGGFRYGGGLGRLPDSAPCSAVSLPRRAMLVSRPKVKKPERCQGAKKSLVLV